MTKDLLPNWHEHSLKHKFIRFIENITNQNSSDYVPVCDRVAVFDHDGTLFVEKPLNAQIAFIKHCIYGEDEYKQRFKKKSSKLSRFERAFNKLEHKFAGYFEDIEETLEAIESSLFDGYSPQEFRAAAYQWIKTAKHPRFNRLYQDCHYTPMREVLSVLQQHDFDIYIVSGSSTDFIRQWSEETYGISAQHILGCSLRTELKEREGQLRLQLAPMPFYFNNGENKVKAIERIIAKQPIIAFGNTHGDVDMLRWTSQSDMHFCGLVHHTDEVREYKYQPDPKLHFSESTLDIAAKYGWNVIDMKKDWKVVF
jgi:phosphoserine phosphatase